MNYFEHDPKKLFKISSFLLIIKKLPSLVVAARWPTFIFYFCYQKKNPGWTRYHSVVH